MHLQIPALFSSPFAWVVLALVSALFTSLRHLYIKKWCSDVPAEVLIFATRVFGTMILLPGLFATGIQIQNTRAFATALVVTVILTALATIVQIRIIQKEALSRSIPLLSFIPLFMIPWTMLFFRQIPGSTAFSGIAMTCIGAYLLNLDKGAKLLEPIAGLFINRPSRLMLAVAAILGCTTACDKIAITASSAFTYTFIWTAGSAIVMFGLAFRNNRGAIIRSLRSGHTFAQALLWTISFLSQMAAVQAATAVASGVTYVKTLTMISVIITVGIGGTVFREGNRGRSLLASAVMVGGAVIVVIFR
jgi:drug/metabolite transporter (DMT)-like permease